MCCVLRIQKGSIIISSFLTFFLKSTFWKVGFCHYWCFPHFQTLRAHSKSKKKMYNLFVVFYSVFFFFFKLNHHIEMGRTTSQTNVEWNELHAFVWPYVHSIGTFCVLITFYNIKMSKSFQCSIWPCIHLFNMQIDPHQRGKVGYKRIKK